MNFDTVLIANRGEIACRIIRSAHALGLKTAAVYSDADAGATHVQMADTAVRLGPPPASQSYLRKERVLEAALATGAGAIHPGYGFLAESADFAAAVAEAGLAFVGPTSEQLRIFGNKHTARQAALASGVPLVAGSGLLESADHAIAEADRIGYPVMLKAVGGGGGIGMQACFTPDELRAAYDRVQRLAASNFSADGVFLERLITVARHVEVQVFGDGDGRVVSLGTRDCSLQRRNQKVIEEAPAPGLPADLVDELLSSARALASSVGYRSAGTVEFVYDAERATASFLEMNTRLQVEHPVTESITGVDLVGWMLRLSGGDATMFDGLPDTGPVATGCAVEARVCAEDPVHDYRPSSGQITAVRFPADTRVDTWIDTGSEVSPFYDSLLAKVVASGRTREEALDHLASALSDTRIYGVRTNLSQLRAAVWDNAFRSAAHTTSTLATVHSSQRRMDVLRAGTMTTIQDYPGRTGWWHVGIPPSGPMDDLSFTLANTAVGNPPGTPALECTLLGPQLRFAEAEVVCVTGAPSEVTVDGEPIAMWEPVVVAAGSVLDVGAPADAGLRTYIAVRGGIDVPLYQGSAATFTLGAFGGITGKALTEGDVLDIAADDSESLAPPCPVAPERRPRFRHDWQLAVQAGPQTAPAYFTDADMAQFYSASWRVSSHANRTGIRLEGPKPVWSREDGGDAGLHPSNLHDNPYSVGAVNVTGDTPVLLGPDGPSLGGFACPLTVVSGHRWQLGQLRPGDTVSFTPVDDTTASTLRTCNTARVGGGAVGNAALRDDRGILGMVEGDADRPRALYLRGGDDNVLVEYGDMVLDLGLRMRVHALAEALAASAIPGIIDVTPGVRSLHIHTDPAVLPQYRLVGLLTELEEQLPETADLQVPSRTIRLPMSFDDPSIAAAIERYRSGIRDTAPWLPSNLEFIRRINGLDSIDDVRKTVFDAEYLVLGLGDVYLGAPLAVPIDPRHRLVTTKYNPARTWTPSDAVGIGGKYLCVYGMESPGGYQLVGRTVPIWSSYRQSAPFENGTPWLFRFFDRIIWEPVTPDQLQDYRAAALAGRLDVEISDGTFALSEHREFLARNAESISAFEARQAAAFAAERTSWHESGEFDHAVAESIAGIEPSSAAMTELPPGASVISAPMVGNVWRVSIEEGQTIGEGDTVAVLEAMKLELPVPSPVAGTVLQVLASPGSQVEPGTPLAVIGAGNMTASHRTPTERVTAAYRRIAEADRPEVWIALRDEAEVLADARRVEGRLAAGDVVPLAGLVVAVKDNIDVAGLPTTAACPEFAYTPDTTAVAVQRLIDAGAIVLGKTNLDQFATGLVGTRSPYGAVRNAHFPDLISGGSSSGSAVAVALGIADLGIGTDTAGSGRVPAALNGIVGIKATCGIIPNHGVVPACVDYDTVTVFAADIELATAATAVMAGPHPSDPRSRAWPAEVALAAPEAPTVAIPEPRNLANLTAAYRDAFERSVSAVIDAGIKVETLDISALLDAARLLYDGAIVAERYAAVGEFLSGAPEHADPTVRGIIMAAGETSGHAFAADLDALAHARAAAAELLTAYDALLLPTTTEHPSISEIEADPVSINRRMGTFTNFCNLLDLAAVAVPGEPLSCGGSFGIMFVVQAFADQIAIDLAAKLRNRAAPRLVPGGVDLAVFGAHLRGQPLHWQLEQHGARNLGEIRTSDAYRLTALDTAPPKPGLVRTSPGNGARIEGELYRISEAGLGRFLAALPAPMALTSIELENGSNVVGFTATHDAVSSATDITELRSWKRYLALRSVDAAAEP